MTDVLIAQAQAAAARARLSDTLDTVRTRLDPRTLARDTVEKIADNGERAVQDGVAVVRRNPAIAIGAAALIGLWFGRRKVAALFAGTRTSAQPALPRRVGTKRPRPVPVKRKPS